MQKSKMSKIRNAKMQKKGKKLQKTAINGK